MLPTLFLLEARQTLRKWREEHTRKSEEAVEIWEHVLSRDSNRLGDELWVVMEQIVIAALDCSRHDLAIEYIQALNVQFPKSSRVKKLQALRLEAIGKHEEEANILYDSMLELDDTNGVIALESPSPSYLCLGLSKAKDRVACKPRKQT